MSILSIAQDVAKEVGFTVPSSLVNNSDEVATQLLFMIKREARVLSDKFNWQALVKSYQFNFVASQQAYNLPSDFRYFIQNTLWNSTMRRPLLGPISFEDYQIQVNYLITSGIDKMVTVFNNQMNITPTPGSTDSINFLYTTTNIFQSSGGSGQTSILADTDTTVVREDLIELGLKLRFLIAKGQIDPQNLELSEEKKEYDLQVQRAVEIDGFGQPNPLYMNTGGNAYWKAAYTQDSNFPSV